MLTKIEKGLPMPEPRARYPFNELEVGDSFLVKNREQTAVTALAAYYKKKLGRTYATSTVKNTHGKVKGVRVWRTK